MHTTLVVIHILGAVVALIGGPLAVRYPNGTPVHRKMGRAYLAGWAVLASLGMYLGSLRAGISAFEVLNTLGVVFVAFALGAIWQREQIGPRWKRWHYRSMVISYGFVVAATINQILVNIGLEYPIWVFVLLGFVPFLFLTPLRRRLDAEYGFASA